MHTKSITWLTVFLLIALLGITLTARGPIALIEARWLRTIDGDTIVVEFEGRQEKIRYVSVNAPGRKACLDEEARLANDKLIREKTLWLELEIDPLSGEYKRTPYPYQEILAHVFLAPVQTPSASVAVLLVAQGLARLYVKYPHDTKIREGQDFDVRYADWIIAAQIEAARERRGWWGECDPYRDSDLVIAAIRQWTDETVYIVNRGTEKIDLAAARWKLTSDPQQDQTLDFRCFVTTLILPPGWILRVHSGPIATGRGGEHHIQEDERTIDWYWRGCEMWRNRRSKSGDEAWLILFRPGKEPQKMYHYSLSGSAWE